ncbi:nuclear elongation and deformation protein 1 [Coprinopsis sp. MPI-PUGE-AT-0042]|nr:nuclear elongation and deformation protein 1 [Coprinopsis sp. MPI-PUGE-AT-0042]
MNYIRGVASAISAPYQYYKELPPINPSTLTGAIDVIVIRRPGPDGDIELACSPFHVRFGKWQVLRPSEKKVNVSVNGQPIPYSMKIGEAGEAFFVFETDDDVPADLITSPILQPTDPESIPDQATERFGTKPDGDGDEDAAQDTEGVEADLEQREVDNQEPDYLDLNANSEDLANDARKSGETKGKGLDKGTTPKQAHHVPSFLQRSDSRVTLNQKNYLAPPSLSRVESMSGERTPEMEFQDRRVDEALKVLSSEGRMPEVEYHSDVALDMDGYHAEHQRERSDRTVRSSEMDYFKLNRSKLSSSTKPQTPSRQSISPDSSRSPSPTESPNSRLKPPAGSHLPFPVFRATSEPPPDVTSHDPDDSNPEALTAASGPTTGTGADASSNNNTTGSTTAHLGLREYSWEWGAFPQPSPLKTTFSKSGRMEGLSFNIGGIPVGSSSSSSSKHRRAKTVQIKNGRLGGMELPVLQDSDEEMEDDEPVTFRGRSLAEKDHGRSHSVPAGVKGSSDRPKRRSRQWKEYEDYDDEDEEEFSGDKENAAKPDERTQQDEEYGFGGALHATKREPTKFILSIEGRRVGFQISVVPVDVVPSEDEQEARQEVYLFFKRKESVETAEVFQSGIVDFEAFLQDESIVSNPRLVIRWIGVEQYVTRQDGSPLMDSLVHWRKAAIQRRASGHNERPVSPASDESRPASPRVDPDSELSGDEGSEKPQTGPSSSDKADQEGGAGNKPTSRSWVQWWRRSRYEDAAARPAMPASRSSPPPSVKALDKEEELKQRLPEPVKKKKYAKTLRLTSDQLKALDLQSGANSITFSLSATGAIAATARIFVWDHTDLILVSDIDGTITKSDGLGHVFAMLGRDWTHLGVAKLYTDITRNGYKIMYLTSRAIGQADATRGYLKGIKQNNYQLPEGPVIMSPDRLMASLHREVIMRKPEVFKMACLRDIQRLFGEHAKYPFYAGFGNRITDALSYRSVNIPSARIFTIDSAGEVKMELLELAGYKSSYIHMTDLVDQMFPPIHRKWTPEFTDFNYWRAPVQDYPLPDLSPPSPALSARSDTTLSRIRNFSLVGSRQPTRENSSIGNGESPYRSSTLRQMSSFEKLSSTLGFSSSGNGNNDPSSQRSASPDPFTSDDEGSEHLSESGRKRERRRSVTSMPGSLHEDDMNFDDDEEEQGEYDDDDGHHEDEEDVDGLQPEEHAEDAFDDDLLAAGEMQKVPFL